MAAAFFQSFPLRVLNILAEWKPAILLHTQNNNTIITGIATAQHMKLERVVEHVVWCNQQDYTSAGEYMCLFISACICYVWEREGGGGILRVELIIVCACYVWER